MKHLRVLNIVGGLATLLLIGSTLWLGGGGADCWQRPMQACRHTPSKLELATRTSCRAKLCAQLMIDSTFLPGRHQSQTTFSCIGPPHREYPLQRRILAAGTQLTPPLTRYPISIDAVYDGNTIIHVLINENCTSPSAVCTPNSGGLYDHPFDITTNTFRPARLISTGNSVAPGFYLGSGGVSGLFDTNGVLHIAYWAGSNHIDYAAFTYAAAADTLTQIDGLIHVDGIGGANHPILAVSPVDNSVTVAWISQASSPTQILARTKTAAGWGAVELVGPSDPNVRVWTNTSSGVSVDQGPALLITADGTKHLVYIQDTDSSGTYGHVRYATYTSSSGWVDQPAPVLHSQSGVDDQ